VGLDINEPGIRSAKELSQTRALGSRARFERCDVSKNLPFDDETFDAALSSDVLWHVPGRLDLLIEMLRALKPADRMLFSDALVIGGMISAEEIATRSSIGFYFYSPPGENDRLLEQAGTIANLFVNCTAPLLKFLVPRGAACVQVWLMPN
jgi:SAM-dependent methyltransferase